jgi:hypothetical protein
MELNEFDRVLHRCARGITGQLAVPRTQRNINHDLVELLLIQLHLTRCHGFQAAEPHEGGS